MTRRHWIDAYFMEFVECCDCNCYVALGASEEAARQQAELFGPDPHKWIAPEQAVQDELACWEPA